MISDHNFHLERHYQTNSFIEKSAAMDIGVRHVSVSTTVYAVVRVSLQIDRTPTIQS